MCVRLTSGHKPEEHLVDWLLTNAIAADPACVITIELAGPPPSDNGKNLWSPTLREMVTAVIDECVVLPGWGGFATYGIEDTANSLFKENTRGYSERRIVVRNGWLPKYMLMRGRGATLHDRLHHTTRGRPPAWGHRSESSPCVDWSTANLARSGAAPKDKGRTGRVDERDGLSE